MKLNRILSFLGVWIALVSVTARANVATQYSAEQTLYATGQTIKAKMYFDQGKMRIEQDMGGMNMTTIIRPDKSVIYQLMPGNMYMEMPIPATGVGAVNPLAVSPGTPDPKTLVGTETINGVTYEKYHVNAGQPGEAFLWLNPQTKLPLKMETADKTVRIEWSNFVTGPQKAELFEVPAGLQRLDTGGMPDMNKVTNGLPQTTGAPNVPNVPQVPNLPNAPSNPGAN